MQVLPNAGAQASQRRRKPWRKPRPPRTPPRFRLLRARTTAKAATLASTSARDITNRALQEKAAAEKALAEGKAALQTLVAALDGVKKEHAQASAAKAGAEKALAEKKAPLDASLAKVQSLKSELEALAVEQKRSAPTPTKDGLASAAKPAGVK